MKLNRFTVSFDTQDMCFLKKHGLFKAASIVKKHYKKHKTPFIDDTYQLAYALGTLRKMLFELSKNTRKHYKLIKLKKKNGGVRYIHSPDKDLKYAQSRILKKILEHIEVSPYATAYIKGKNLKDNALPHVNHKYLLKMDITDFFGSITYLQVISAAFNSKRFPTQIGAMLTSLCCLNDVLPQGAPTSPMLSNIVMKNFDDILGDWCEERGIAYTRYCDDLTFSANIPLYSVYRKACNMLEKRGFEVNISKTKFVTSTTSQRVTGLTVNKKVSIPNEYKKQLRQEVYYAIKFGLADSIIKSNKAVYIKRGIPDIHCYYNHLQGKMFYVLGIEPNNTWFATATDKLKEKYYNEITKTPTVW